MRKNNDGSLADAYRVLDAVARSNLVVSVGFTMHFHPAMRYVKNAIVSGRLGEILQVHWHVGTYVTLMNSGSRYQAVLAGSPLMDYAHQPDIIRWWLGDMPTAVFAAGNQGGDLALQSNPNVMAVTIEYGQDVLATINLNYVQQPDHVSCTIIGD